MEQPESFSLPCAGFPTFVIKCIPARNAAKAVRGPEKIRSFPNSSRNDADAKLAGTMIAALHRKLHAKNCRSLPYLDSLWHQHPGPSLSGDGNAGLERRRCQSVGEPCGG